MPNGESLPGVGPSKAIPGAGWALALLLGINLFNYIDRQVLSATLPLIRLDASIFRPDDPWATTKLGALTTAFMVAYTLLSPLFGRLGDTMRRWAIVGIAVLLWSMATGGTGLAASYLMLFFTRCLVGIGEAAYGPVAPAMLSDAFPPDHRGRVMAWFYAAIPVGSALGFVIGSQVADAAGWRWAFYVVVFPGIALGTCCFFMREPPRRPTPQSEPVAPSAPAPSYRAVLRELRGIRSFVLCCAGMTASTFVLGGVATVMQLYIFEREARFTLDAKALTKLTDLKDSAGERVIPPAVTDKLQAVPWATEMTLPDFKAKLQATLTETEFKAYSSFVYEKSPAEGSLTNGTIGLYLGGIVVISGLLATLLGGVLGDRLTNRGMKGAYFHVVGWSMMVGFPFFVAMLYVPFPMAWGLLFVAVFFLFFNTGPANTILANVVRSEIRATAFAVNIFIIHAFGDAISPLVIGFIADLSSLHVAFLFVSFLIPISAVLWVMGAPHLDEDTTRANGLPA
jgi:MFS transporter, Spinster family, sphingosine-1-phosphate transporter